MEEFLESRSISEQVRQANSKDGPQLRALVRKIEGEFVEQVQRDGKEEASLRCLWVRLVQVAVEAANVELAILLAAKLKLVQLALALTSTLRPGTSLSYSMALAYVANYFRAQSARDIFDCAQQSAPLSASEFETLLEFLVTGCQWDKALALVRVQFAAQELQHLFTRLVLYRRAQFEEAEEEFEEALRNYEAAEAPAPDLVRLVIKLHLEKSAEVLPEYCELRGGSVLSFWQAMARFQEELEEEEEEEQLPAPVKHFIEDEARDKWLDSKQVDYVAGVVSSSSRQVIQALARECLKSEQVCDLNKSMGCQLILGDWGSFARTLEQSRGTEECLSIYTHLLAGPHQELATATSYFLAYGLTSSRPAKSKQRGSGYFMACIKLGLVNEALEELSVVAPATLEADCLEQALKHLESYCQSDKTAAIDPRLEPATLGRLEPVLGDNQLLTTAVISIVILASTIGLNSGALADNNEPALRKLDALLAEAGHEFQVSDGLVRRLSALVAGVRRHLQVDGLADSRRRLQRRHSQLGELGDTLSRLVERGAALGLMQARYRCAARLYQLLGDHANAVKSLMRLGDVELVTGYSLLVRDVTVNRLTVNYLRHLAAEPRVIEDFIARSREPGAEEGNNEAFE